METTTLPYGEYMQLKAADAASDWFVVACEAAEAWYQLGHLINAQDPIMWKLLQSAEVRSWVTEAYVAEVDRHQRVGDAEAISAMRAWKDAGPSYDTLRRLRQQPGQVAEAARVRRGGREYTGGPVDWKTGLPAQQGVAK